MNSSKLRTIIAAAVFAFLSLGLIFGVNFGTLSGFGPETIALLCPLGALATIIATKTLVPQTIVSLIIMVALVFVAGRVFCGWICPVPLLNRIREFFRSPKKRKEIEQEKRDEVLSIAKSELECGHDCSSCGAIQKHAHKKLDSRHYVLGGALLSTVVFGFPVFCLVCPIGLTFASVLVIWRLFSVGDMTLTVVLIPLMLIIELVFLRKWCGRFCPLAGLMNIVSRFGRTYQPTINNEKCLETSKNTPCSRCAEVCEADINLRHLDFGEHTLADCTRCRACVDACPAKAISMPLLPKKKIEKETTKVDKGAV